MKDRPIMTQKMASEPKPQARNTVSNAMRRMSSMIPATLVGPSPRSGTLSANGSACKSCSGRPTEAVTIACGFLQADLEEIAGGRKGQHPGAGEPDPQRDRGRIVLGADHPLVDRRRHAAQDDGGGREHQ